MSGTTILLSEGSSLSAREAITALGLAGHYIEIISSEPICLGRFSRFVRRVHSAPASAVDPDGYLAVVLDVLARRKIDVLLPINEQAYLFAAARHRFSASVNVALSDFDAFEQVQSKARFSELLTRLDLPQPDTEIVTSPQRFQGDWNFPRYVKTAFDTASSGIWQVNNLHERDHVRQELEAKGAFADGVLVQVPVRGALERAQTVFDRGRLVAINIYRQVVEGPRGGDVIKVSVNRPDVGAMIERIGSALRWHGALSFDYILEPGTETPRFLDANPRLVEPMTGALSGVDLAGCLLSVSVGEAPSPRPAGRVNVRTRLSLMGILKAAGRNGRRSDVLGELCMIARKKGRYIDTVEELTPLHMDPWSVLPVVAVALQLIISPHRAERLAQQAVGNYSLSPKSVRRAREWARSRTR